MPLSVEASASVAVSEDVGVSILIWNAGQFDKAFLDTAVPASVKGPLVLCPSCFVLMLKHIFFVYIFTDSCYVWVTVVGDLSGKT